MRRIMITRQKLFGLAICLMILVPLLGFGSITGDDKLGKQPNSGPTTRSRAGGNIIVDINGNGNYTSIQDAVDNASSGDNITVWPGVYLENITIDKKLNLTGSGRAVTFINASGTGSGIHIIADRVNISGFTINNSGYQSDFAGIKIENADNCTIMNNNCSENIIGIKIINSNYTRMINNEIEMNNNGIILTDAQNTTIMNNTCEHNYGDGLYINRGKNNKVINNSFSWCGSQGIELYRSDFNIIDNNNCSGRAFWNDGIRLYYSDWNKINNNTCNDNDWYGMTIERSNNNIFENNTCLNNQRSGIGLFRSPASVVRNNKMVNCGLLITGSEINDFVHNIDHSNMINGKTLYYYKDRSGKSVPQDAGAVILVNCSQFVIDGLVLNNGSAGIQLIDSSNVTVTDNTCNGNYAYGIYLFSSKDIVITDNICKYNGYTGVSLDTSQNVFIKNNLLLNSQQGIFSYYSKYNEITNNICSDHSYYGINVVNSDYDKINNNTCNDNLYGMLIAGDFSIIDNNTCLFNGMGFIVGEDNNIVTNNTCSFNNFTGLIISGCYENTVKNNTLTSNKYYGMEIMYGHKNIFTDNFFYNNTIHGIYLSQDSENNTFFNNNFISNGNQSSDNGKNSWNTTTGVGNFWADLEVKYPNATNDGYIWDTPYEIHGWADALDYYPLVKDVSDFVLNLRPTAIIEQITPNPAIYGENVTFSGQGIDQDGLITRYKWGSNIDGSLSNRSSFNTSSLSLGNHTISFSVLDDLGSWSVKDTKNLVITPETIYNGTYLYHEPIVINNNEDFTYPNGVVSGSGTSKNPFIIEGWKILGHVGVTCRSCIYIKNTDAHFIIRDNYLNDSGLCQIGSAGIQLSNITNGTIENNIILGEDFGNMYGIWLEQSNNISITGNRIMNSSDAALTIFYSKNNTIANNYCFDNRMGIYSIGSNDNIFKNNWFIGSNYFFDLSSSDRNVISYNNVINFSRVRIWRSENNTFHHNNFIDYGDEKIIKQSNMMYNNSWDDGNGQGNFWSNYSGRDNGESGRIAGDGVGDTKIPYLDLDNHPLMEPGADFLEQVKQNISVEFNIDKENYFSGEEITGKIRITNNNYFDLYTDDPSIFPMSHKSMSEFRIEFINLETNETFQNSPAYIAKIDARSTLSDNLSLPGIVFKYIPSKILPSIKRPTGNYSIKIDFPLYITRLISFDINTTTKTILKINDHPIIENISMSIETSKSTFHISEPITGTIDIYNNNPFDIRLIARPPYLMHMLGHHFTIYSIENGVTIPGINNFNLTPIIVEANNNVNINFIIDSFYNDFKSSSGNYSIYSWFYYSNDSLYYQDLLDNNPEILRIESNHADFQIGPGKVGGSNNISILLSLDKPEFLVGETITGTVTINNNNPFDIVLDDVLYQRVSGHHFTIYSSDNDSNFGGIASDFQGSLRVKAKNRSVITFKIDKFMLPITSKMIQYVGLSQGNYSMYAFFYYTNSTDKINSDILWSNRVEFRIIENRSVPDDTNDDEGGNDRPQGLLTAAFLYPIAGVCIVIIILTSIFITGTEVGKYGFFAAIGPLYTKTRKRKKGHKHEYSYIKGLVRGYVLGNPGESYNTIKRVLELPNGTLAYYLKVLTRESVIRAERDGFLKRFYPMGGKITQDILELNKTQENIKHIIQKQPGISQKDILSHLDLSQQKLNYHVQLMVKARIIRLERQGKIAKCYVIDGSP